MGICGGGVKPYCTAFSAEETGTKLRKGPHDSRSDEFRKFTDERRMNHGRDGAGHLLGAHRIRETTKKPEATMT